MTEQRRLASLDALRGFDMMFIMGGELLVRAVAAAFGHPEFRATFGHAEWHGLHFMDTVFPLFLFMAGVSWPFSMAAQEAKGRTRAAIVRKVLWRGFMLFFLGLAFFSPFFSLDPSKFRYSSVLCHIGVCWAAAALLFLFARSWKARLAVAATLLVGHWAVLFFTTAPDTAAILASGDPRLPRHVAAYMKYGTDGFSFFGSVACWIDRTYMPGALGAWLYENDGTLAKLSGIALATFGMFAGELLRSGLGQGDKVRGLLALAALSAALACAWMPWCPINKRLWTPSFVLLVGGYAFAMLALFHWLIDVKGWRRWSFFFTVIGMNSTTVYLAQRIVDFRRVSEFFLSGVAGMMPGAWGEVVLCAGYLAACWLMLYFLFRKNIFLKV